MTHYHTTSNRTFWKRMTGFLGTTSLALGLLCGAPSGAFADTDTTDRQTSKEQQLKRKMDELRKQYNRLRRDKRRKARTTRRPAPRRRYRTRRDDDRRYRRQDDRYDRRDRRRRYDRRNDRRTRSRYDRRDDRYDTRRNTRRRRRDRYDTRQTYRRHRDDRYDRRRTYRRDMGRRYDRYRFDSRTRLGDRGRYNRRNVSQQTSLRKPSFFREGTRRHSLFIGSGPSLGGETAISVRLNYNNHLSGKFGGLAIGADVQGIFVSGGILGGAAARFAWYGQLGGGGVYLAPYAEVGVKFVISGYGAGFVFAPALGGELVVLLGDRVALSLRIPVSLSFGDGLRISFAPSLYLGITF